MPKSKKEIANEKKFMDLLAKARPDIWAMEVFRQELNMANLDWLRNVMRGVYNIGSGTGFGEVIIQIKNNRIYLIMSKETDKMDKRLFP